MTTLEQALSERTSTIDAVEKRARDILHTICAVRGYILIGRKKTLESLRDKLETGRYSSLNDIDDIVAFSVVIDTLNQEREIRSLIRKLFKVEFMRAGSTLKDERVFDFDCTRIYCRLRNIAEVSSPIYDQIFEIQIRTILQHAWSKITHPHVYKASVYDAKAGRLAAETMAQIESLDRVLSRFKTTSRTVKAIERVDMIESAHLTKLIDELVMDGTIPQDLRPVNGRRLGENIYSSIRRDKRQMRDLWSKTIADFLKKQTGSFPRSVTLYQLAIVALMQANLLEYGRKGRYRQYYVTDDLISLFPSAAEIPNRISM